MTTLEKIIKAWESLPGDRRYSVGEVQSWLINTMKPAIDAARKELSEQTVVTFIACNPGDDGIPPSNTIIDVIIHDHKDFFSGNEQHQFENEVMDFLRMWFDCQILSERDIQDADDHEEEVFPAPGSQDWERKEDEP